MVEGEKVASIGGFQSKEEGVYFMWLMNLTQRRKDFSGWYYDYGVKHISNKEYGNVSPLTRQQALKLVNHAQYSYWQRLHDLGNKTATMLVDNARIDQGLEPMQKITVHERTG